MSPTQQVIGPARGADLRLQTLVELRKQLNDCAKETEITPLRHRLLRLTRQLDAQFLQVLQANGGQALAYLVLLGILGLVGAVILAGLAAGALTFVQAILTLGMLAPVAAIVLCRLMRLQANRLDLQTFVGKYYPLAAICDHREALEALAGLIADDLDWLAQQEGLHLPATRTALPAAPAVTARAKPVHTPLSFHLSAALAILSWLGIGAALAAGRPALALACAFAAHLFVLVGWVIQSAGQQFSQLRPHS